MTDEWTEKLQCPQCRSTGIASLSQHNTDRPIVGRLSAGFKVVQTEYGPDLYCESCDVPVSP
jgi:hypothetical protein